MAWVREHWNTCVRCCTRDGCVVVHKFSGWDGTEIPDPASVSWICVHVACGIRCESEVRALATEAVLVKLESPLCNKVDGFGSFAQERCKVKGRRKRTSSWLRRSKSPFTSIWSHQSVVRLCTPVSGPSWKSRFPGALGLVLPFKHLYTLQIRETFAKEGVLGPINLFDWKRVGLLIMYLCCHHPFFVQRSLVP